MTENLQQKWIANFWGRVGAFFIDAIIIGLVGFLLGQVLEETFVQMGGWGRFVGFVIGLAYFGLMNSKLCGGQTIGKKLLNLKVVDSNNQSISVARSILRYTVLATPFSLNGAQFTNEAMFSFLIYPLSLIIFGGLFSIIYLYIFNRVTRQSLHDLAAGTFVVNINVEKQETGGVWTAHFIVIAIIFAVAAILPVFTAKLTQNAPFKNMLAVQAALLKEPGVSYATVITGIATFSSAKEESKTSTYVAAQVFLLSNNVGDARLARQLASVVVKNYPEITNKDAFNITLVYGYDIGIWSYWSTHTHNFNLGDFANLE